MIELEHAVLPSPEQIEFAIEGLRNSFNSGLKVIVIGAVFTEVKNVIVIPAIVSNQINVHGLHNL